MIYQPTASIGGHVTVNLYWLGLVIINVDSIDAIVFIAVLHYLSTVHREGVQQSN